MLLLLVLTILMAYTIVIFFFFFVVRPGSDVQTSLSDECSRCPKIPQ